MLNWGKYRDCRMFSINFEWSSQICLYFMAIATSSFRYFWKYYIRGWTGGGSGSQFPVLFKPDSQFPAFKTPNSQFPAFYLIPSSQVKPVLWILIFIPRVTCNWSTRKHQQNQVEQLFIYQCKMTTILCLKSLIDQNLDLGPHFGGYGPPKMVWKWTSLLAALEDSNFQGLLLYDVEHH